MRILVVAATRAEILPSEAFLREQAVDILITDVGMLATTYALTKKLQESTYDLIINVGVGGILDRTTPLGKVYRVVKDNIYRFGAEDGQAFLPIESLGFGVANFNEHLAVALRGKDLLAPSIEGITVNTVHGFTASIKQLRQHYSNNVMESMEGAAVFFVAHQEQVPVLQFRAASNYIEPRNREAWQIGKAIASLNDFLQKLIPIVQEVS